MKRTAITRVKPLMDDDQSLRGESLMGGERLPSKETSVDKPVPKVGVLALQGSFREHQEALQRIGIPSVQVRLPEHLEGLSHLILPGGESTTIGQLMIDSGLLEAMRKRTQGARKEENELACYGTCAGAILMSRHILDAKQGQPCLGMMDLQIRRNAFGRQIDSFTSDLDLKGIGEKIPTVFIRAPLIEMVGPDVEVLGRLPSGAVVAAKQGKHLVTMFHPELTHDDRIYRYFLGLG